MVFFVEFDVVDFVEELWWEIVVMCFEERLCKLIMVSFGVVEVMFGVIDFDEVLCCVDVVFYKVKCDGCNWVEFVENFSG